MTALLLVGAVISGFRMTPTDAPCVSMRYLIEDKAERMYLTESELNMLLYAEDVYPLGRKLNLVSLHRIERAIKAHPMVRTAECYLTPRNEVRGTDFPCDASRVTERIGRCARRRLFASREAL